MFNIDYFYMLAAKLHLLNNMDDEKYIKHIYHAKTGKKLNLESPKTFNEKLQWLKLYDRKTIYTKVVDKYDAKEYVANIIGKDHIIKNYGVWDRFEEIDFNKLPNKFVLKCTHDSGGIVICNDKESFDIISARKKIEKSLKSNYYLAHREWPYKNIKPRIIAEEFLSSGNNDLVDYKVHCFNGQPRFILVCKNRFKASGMTEDFYSIEWERFNLRRPNYSNSDVPDEKPRELSEIIELSKLLSKDFYFVRTDFYIVEGKVYFGELTLYPTSGFGKFVPDTYDLMFGEFLDLPGIGNLKNAE